MKYTGKPITAVWELTFACNMRCKHCGSSCNSALPDELTEEEALNLCDQIGKLNLVYLTLSGGEPLLCKHWYKIARRLRDNNVTPNMITNGWMLSEEMIHKAKEAGISNIAISIDGLKDTHDFMRKEGSFDRIMNALDLLKKMKMPASVITTVNKRNLPELPEMHRIFKEKGVMNWQLQYAMLMGNLLEFKDLQIQPEQIDDIIDFAYEVYREGALRIDLSDCVGYYNNKEVEIRSAVYPDLEHKLYTNGCAAGKYSFGIRCNGNIVGCTSLRDELFLEDNIRNRSLIDIWEDPKSFKWNRELKRTDMEGFCANCQFGSYCLAGCSVMKFTSEKKLTENKFCSYNVAVKQEKEKIFQIKDIKKLLSEGIKALQEEEFQIAEIYYSRLREMNGNKTSILNTLGFIYFSLENYNECLNCNKKVLEFDPENAYALKGMGLCLTRMGFTGEGINYLKKSITYADKDFMDPYHDLAVVYHDENMLEEALQVLDKGRNISDKFRNETTDFYDYLKEKVRANCLLER